MNEEHVFAGHAIVIVKRSDRIFVLYDAAKYTPRHGAVTPICTVGSKNSASDAVVVTVADNGIGITPSALPTIFEPFVQDAHAIGFAADGLGMG